LIIRSVVPVVATPPSIVLTGQAGTTSALWRSTKGAIAGNWDPTELARSQTRLYSTVPVSIQLVKTV
jgi:hypothetical protein